MSDLTVPCILALCVCRALHVLDLVMSPWCSCCTSTLLCPCCSSTALHSSGHGLIMTKSLACIALIQHHS